MTADLQIEYLATENIRPAPWRATYIFGPDLKLLAASVGDIGIRYPILVREEDMTIIDGHARWLVAQKHPTLKNRCPVELISCSESDAKVMHIRMNRGRGTLIARDLSDLVNDLIDDGGLEEEDLRILFNMSVDEFEILVNGSLIKRKKLKDHKYNSAWVPVETSGKAERIVVERPKTPDR